MFGPYWQYQLPLWVVFFLFLVLLLIPMEIGFQIGMRQKLYRSPSEGEVRGDVTLASMMALLGLMLAFTYSFSLSRSDLRKTALITEVNAISTAFVRADLLSEPGRTQVRQLLFDYAKSRYVEPETVRTLKEVEQIVDRSVKTQSKIWPAVKRALRQQGSISNPEKALLVSAINGVFDSDTSRMAAFFDRLPTAVLALLVFIGGLSLGLAAYNSGLRGRFDRMRMTSFAFILAALMYIILDYDMMMRGFIQIDQRSLVLLIKQMQDLLQY